MCEVNIVDIFRKVKWPSLNLAVFAARELKDIVGLEGLVTQSNDGLYSNPPAGVALEVVTLRRGHYVVVPSTFEPFEGRFILKVYTSSPLASIRLE